MEQLHTLIQPWIDLLSAKHGWLPAVLGGMATARLAIKPFSLALQSLLARAFAFVHETQEADDDEFIAAMLKRRWYRVLVFLVDTLASVKLPTALPAAPVDSPKAP